MSKTESELYQVIWLVRRLFRGLSQKSSENLVEFDISVADRAVMEFLYPNNALSVPDIAERYKVSRQHIQATVNTLLKRGLVEVKANPNHKRSPFIMLNPKGRKLFCSIMKKDEALFEQLFSHISKSEIQVTKQTLQSILAKLI